jgi:DNA-binding NtrC family response regulator
VEAVGSTREALERLRGSAYPIVLSDIYLDERTGLDVLAAARQNNPKCAVILMTGRATMETVMAATRSGAFEYISKPFDLDDLLDVVKRAEASLSPVEEDDYTEYEELPPTEMIGSSGGMVEVYKLISRVAPTDVTVLIEGETGTGKEMIARMIHRNSPRSNDPFLPVDCGSIPASLLESELFGALRGSYTGADRDRVGVFEAANRGTVFLDEIGEIDLDFQQKLLRVLQEREVRPVGASKSRPIDVRVIAATNRDLKKMVQDGKFREDLWYRLDVVRIEVPPLRERHGDMPLLVQFFLERSNARFGSKARITEGAVRVLEEYTWPGNVRQLQHLIERLAILSPGGRIDDLVVRETLFEGGDNASGGETLAETEAEQIRRVLAACGNNKSRAAKVLGIERKTLYRKLERMGL